MCWKAQGIQDKLSVRTEQARRLASRACRSLLYPIVRLPFCSVRRSFRFNFFYLLLLPSIFNSYIRSVYLFLSSRVVHFVTSFLSFSVLHPVRLPLPFLSAGPFHCIRPFVATLPFHSLLLSFRFNSFTSPSLLFPFRFNSSLLFPIRCSFCFKLFSSVWYCLPSFFNASILFIYLFLSFQGVHFVIFVISCLSFQGFNPVRLPLPFVSSRSFRYLPPFASTLLSCSSCSSFPFNSSISLHPSFRCNSSLPFVTSFAFCFNSFSSRSLPFPFRFNSSLLFPLRRFFRLKL